METQTQLEYKKQINDFIDFESRISKYRHRYKAIVTYLLLAYRQRFFTLENSPLNIDDLKDECKALINDVAICETIDKINRFPGRNFFIASSLTLFNRLVEHK